MGVRIQNEETVTELWLSLMAEGRRMHRRYSNNRGITFGLTRPDGRDILIPIVLNYCASCIWHK
jgi:hypothetical protein